MQKEDMTREPECRSPMKGLAFNSPRFHCDNKHETARSDKLQVATSTRPPNVPRKRLPGPAFDNQATSAKYSGFLGSFARKS